MLFHSLFILFPSCSFLALRVLWKIHNKSFWHLGDAVPCFVIFFLCYKHATEFKDITFFLVFSLVRLNYSPADPDLPPACCSSSKAKISINTATLLATDLIKSCTDPVIVLSLLSLPLPRSPFPSFSSVPFDEWLGFFGRMTAQWLIVCARSLFHHFTCFSYFAFCFSRCNQTRRKRILSLPGFAPSAYSHK